MSTPFTPEDRKTQTVSATSTASTATFDVVNTSMMFKNKGPNTVFVRMGATATTADYPILASTGELLTVPTTTVSLICAATETATVYISPGFGV